MHMTFSFHLYNNNYFYVSMEISRTNCSKYLHCHKKPEKIFCSKIVVDDRVYIIYSIILMSGGDAMDIPTKKKAVNNLSPCVTNQKYQIITFLFYLNTIGSTFYLCLCFLYNLWLLPNYL